MKLQKKKLKANPPKFTIETKTGSWRAMRPVLDPDACTKCGICWMSCPEGAIKKTDTGFEIDLEYCKGCAICAKRCPIKAIKMVVEEK
jgi:pyruvate ferredoxin oxidoreductase delta subunit